MNMDSLGISLDRPGISLDELEICRSTLGTFKRSGSSG